MANTLNYGFPKPDIANNIDEEFYVFRDTTLDMIDAAIKAVADAAASKAALVHGHEIGDVIGLAGALASKMPADATFTLDSLTDVDGAAGAAVNNVLVKDSSGLWVPSSALAALGPHGHTISEITGLSDVLVSKADGAAVASALGLKADKSTTVTGAGLASGGGNLSANRVITVTKATDAEHEERVRDDVAATPKGVGLAIDATSLGRDQAWQNVSASRAFNVNYTNTTGRPIAVSVKSAVTQSSAILLQVDAIEVDRDQGEATTAIEGTVATIVPNGAVYRCNSVGGPSGLYWVELR